MDCLTKAYHFATCLSQPKYPDPYNFEFGHKEDTKANAILFESNFVRTSKYHWYDFVPSKHHSTFRITFAPI